MKNQTKAQSAGLNAQSKAIKRNNKRIHVRKFLSTPEGRKWLEEKQKERQEMQLVRELSQFI